MPTFDAISRRAYEIFKARGGVGGDPVSDWLQAERELQGSAHERSSTVSHEAR